MLIASHAIALAGDMPAADPKLAAAGWKEFHFSDIAPAEFRLTAPGVIDVESRDGASLLYRLLSETERTHPVLHFRWRVDTAVPATDLRVVGKDDRDLTVHVWFPEEDKGLFSALGSAVAKAMGAPVTGKALSYAFGGKGRRGERIVNPFREGEAFYYILRPSGTATGVWFNETIDFVADYERAFGAKPPAPSHIAISTDSDDTDTASAGRVADIKFTDE